MIDYLALKLKPLITDKRFSEILIGSSWALGARLVASCLGLTSSIIIARVYGPEVMGIVVVIQSFLILTTIFTVLGTNTSILRLIPEHLVKHSPTSALKIYRKAQYLVIFVSLFTGALFFGGANFIADKVFSKPHLSFYFALGSGFVVFKSLMLLNTQAIRGLKLIRVFAMMQILPQCFNLVILIILGILWQEKNVPVYSMLGGFTLTAIFGWIIIEYNFKKQIKADDFVRPLSIKDIISLSLPMLITASMTFIIGQTGIIVLGMFRTEAEVGYYSVAVKLATLTSYVFSAVNTIAAPKFSSLFHSGKIDELFYLAKKSAKLIFWTATPILIWLFIFGKYAILLIYGSKFAVAYTALLFLILGQFVNSISGVTGNFMNMTGHQKILKNVIFIAAILSICLNFLLIPKYGLNGAAFSGMFGICFWNIITLLYIRKKFGRTIGYMPLMY